MKIFRNIKYNIKRRPVRLIVDEWSVKGCNVTVIDNLGTYISGLINSDFEYIRFCREVGHPLICNEVSNDGRYELIFLDTPSSVRVIKKGYKTKFRNIAFNDNNQYNQ